MTEKRQITWWQLFALEGILFLLMVAAYFVGLRLGAPKWMLGGNQ